ncbi:MAG: cytochrome C oxidase subunit I [Burkholderiales bacterium]
MSDDPAAARPDAPPRPRSTRALWLLLAVCVAPIVASYAAFYFWRPAGTVNYGELLPPQRLADAPLTLANGKPFAFERLRGKWLLVSVDRAACDAWCGEKLVWLRQLRLTQGKEMDRVERVWLVSDDGAPAGAPPAALEGLWIVRAAGAPVLAQFPATGQPADFLYVVDPLGNVMMRYPRGADPNRIKKDLTRLLKVSQVG